MISFEIETASSNGYTFVDKLLINIDHVSFGINGSPSERGLLVGGIETLIKNIAIQQHYPEFLNFLSTQHRIEAFSILDEGCWGGGAWYSDGAFGALPSPFLFSALPTATELFDSERAFFIHSVTAVSRIVYKAELDGSIQEIEVRSPEYISMWKSILERLSSRS